MNTDYSKQCGNSSISMLKGENRVRKRSGVILKIKSASSSTIFYKKGGHLSVYFHLNLCGRTETEWLISMNKGLNKRKTVSGGLLLLPFLLTMIYVLWEPTIQGIIMSFFKMQGYTPLEFWGVRNYKIVMKDSWFLKTLWNTISYVLWSLVIGFWIPFVLAVLLNELRRFQGFFQFCMYLPALAPGVAISMLWYYMYYPNSSGLLNMFLGLFGVAPQVWLTNANMTIPLILIRQTWTGLGGTMLMYLAALQGINRELYEAALLDGSGIWHRFRYITLPHVLPLLLLNLIRQIIGVFQIMETPLAMTGGGPNNASMSLGLLAYKNAFQFGNIGNALAINVIMFVLLIAMTAFYFKVQEKVSIDE